MSAPLFKLIAAQRLLDELRESLEGDSLQARLRMHANERIDRLSGTTANRDGMSAAGVSLQEMVNAKRRFATIYADPPWQYANAASRGAAENHYETMTINAMADLPIAQLAAAEAHLHLWTTNAFLFEAERAIKAWSCTYKSCLVWIKPQIGNGNYWRVSHEFLLLGVRGNLTFPDRSQQSWLFADRGRHSAKPIAFRKLVERVSPGPRLELFARSQAEGWTT